MSEQKNNERQPPRVRGTKQGRRRKGGRRNKSKQALVAFSGRGSVPSYIEPWIPLFPSRLTKKLRYNDTAILSSTAGATATYVLRANDLYDPDFTGTGHQAMGFDQMMLYYQHFVVAMSRCTVVFENTCSVPSHCVLRFDNNSTATVTPSRVLEMGGSQVVVCESKNVSGSVRTADLTMDICKLQGVSRTALTADPALRGTNGLSPTDGTYWQIEIWNNQGSSGSVYIDFTLELEAIFTEPIMQVAS